MSYRSRPALGSESPVSEPKAGMNEWEKALSKDKPSLYAEWPLNSRKELDAISIHRQEGLSAEDEAFFRRFYTQFIMETGRRLKMRVFPVAESSASGPLPALRTLAVESVPWLHQYSSLGILMLTARTEVYAY